VAAAVRGRVAASVESLTTPAALVVMKEMVEAEVATAGVVKPVQEPATAVELLTVTAALVVVIVTVFNKLAAVAVRPEGKVNVHVGAATTVQVNGIVKTILAPFSIEPVADVVKVKDKVMAVLPAAELKVKTGTVPKAEPATVMATSEPVAVESCVVTPSALVVMMARVERAAWAAEGLVKPAHEKATTLAAAGALVTTVKVKVEAAKAAVAVVVALPAGVVKVHATVVAALTKPARGTTIFEPAAKAPIVVKVVETVTPVADATALESVTAAPTSVPGTELVVTARPAAGKTAAVPKVEQ
jgi:hypothetical protein